jgi:co-chaperonin GroES (HSP10)
MEIFKKVLNNHVVIEVDEFKYDGRIVIPETAKRSPTKGRVIAKDENVTSVELGDTVLYSQFAGYPIQFQGVTKLRIVGESEILAVLHPDSPKLEVS